MRNFNGFEFSSTNGIQEMLIKFTKAQLKAFESSKLQSQNSNNKPSKNDNLSYLFLNNLARPR